MIRVRHRDRPQGPPRVLLTRDEEGCHDWSRRLAALGIDAVSLPCLEHATTEDPGVVARFLAAVASAGGGDWLVFTSRRGVEAAASLLVAASLPVPDGVRVAAVGPATAESSCRHFGRCDAEPLGDSVHGEGLARRLLGEPVATALVCVARGGRRDIEEILASAGWTVDRFDLYTTRAVSSSAARHDGQAVDLSVDAVFLASPSAVAGLFAQAEVSAELPLLAIGPTTAGALEAAGRAPASVAASPGLDSMVQLLRRLTQITESRAEARSQALETLP